MERKFNDTTNIKQLEFKETTKKNLIPLLIDESYMFYDNKTVNYSAINLPSLIDQTKSLRN